MMSSFPPPLVQLVVVVALLLASSHPRTTTTCVHSGWIDKDTPTDARMTIPAAATAKTVPTIDATGGGASTLTTTAKEKIKAGGGSTATAAIAMSDPTTTSPAAPDMRGDPTPPSPPAGSDVDEAETLMSSTPAASPPDGAEVDATETKSTEVESTEAGKGGGGAHHPAVRTYNLVFSDEFNAPHRTFEDGSDPRWTALDKNDYTNDAQHYYSPRNAKTDSHRNLVITTESANTDVEGFNDVTRENKRLRLLRRGYTQGGDVPAGTARRGRPVAGVLDAREPQATHVRRIVQARLAVGVGAMHREGMDSADDGHRLRQSSSPPLLPSPPSLAPPAPLSLLSSSSS